MRLAKFFGCVAAAIAAGAINASAAQAAVTVETAPFISAPIAANDFEAMAPTIWLGNTPYSQGGITVNYVSPTVSAIMFTNLVPIGTRDWFSVGNIGYTSITLTGGGSFNQIQFSAYSGWGEDTGDGLLDYDLLYHGVSVGTGSAGFVHFFSFLTYGLSGPTFDEVRLQVRSTFDGGPTFDPNAQDALGLDNILIGRTAAVGGGVPEPAAWALMIAGFGLAGASLRRRRATILA